MQKRTRIRMLDIYAAPEAGPVDSQESVPVSRDGGANPPLIPTGLRDKLPRGLSHPVGAEVLSHTLHECPRYNLLWLAFGSKPLCVASTARDFREFRLALIVVCNTATKPYLKVPAVPSAERALARELLITIGLPGVRNWLCLPRPATWFEGKRLFQVGYTLEPSRVCFIETLNDRVIAQSIVATAADQHL